MARRSEPARAGGVHGMLQGELSGGRPELSGISWTASRVSALARTYGADSPLARFYTDGAGSFIGFEQDLATVYLAPGVRVREAEQLLEMTAGRVLSERPLQLAGFAAEEGVCFCHAGLSPARLSGVTGSIRDAYDLLHRAFPAEINANTYRTWYADLSHRVRHGMSLVATLPDICTGTLYCLQDGLALVEQLAVAPERRGEGFGRAMLRHLAAEAGGAVLVVCSAGADSDRFYRKLGFSPAGRWYRYTRRWEGPCQDC